MRLREAEEDAMCSQTTAAAAVTDAASARKADAKAGRPAFSFPFATCGRRLPVTITVSTPAWTIHRRRHSNRGRLLRPLRADLTQPQT